MPFFTTILILPALLIGGAGIAVQIIMHMKEGALVYRRGFQLSLIGAVKIITLMIFSENLLYNSTPSTITFVLIDKILTLLLITQALFFVINLIRWGDRMIFFIYLVSILLGVTLVLLFILGFFFPNTWDITTDFSRVIDAYAVFAALFCGIITLVHNKSLEKSRFLPIKESSITAILLLIITGSIWGLDFLKENNNGQTINLIQFVLYTLSYTGLNTLLFSYFSALALKKEDTLIELAFSEEFITRFAISNREQEVLNYILKGMPNQQIADRMFISLSTVKSHIHRIFRKAGVKTRIELINKVNST